MADGELLVLLGSSGCGKTTALRLVAGLEEVTEGAVSIGDLVVNDVDPKDRDVAMVFQSYALYPHLTVAKNIEFPLRQRGAGKEERAAKVRRAAETLGLAELLGRKPAQLSGGQRQRVALARAIVREPTVFLMDEPLSNLDAALRVQTRADIVELQSRLSTTTLYVTHDQVEAMTMGHRIAVMSHGAAPASGTARRALLSARERLRRPFPREPRHEPPARASWSRRRAVPRRGLSRRLAVSFPGASVALPPSWPVKARGAGPDVVLGLRPEALSLSPDGEIAASVIIVELLGAETHVICNTEDGTRLIVRQAAGRPSPALARTCASPWTETRVRTTCSRRPRTGNGWRARDGPRRDHGRHAEPALGPSLPAPEGGWARLRPPRPGASRFSSPSPSIRSFATSS